MLWVRCGDDGCVSGCVDFLIEWVNVMQNEVSSWDIRQEHQFHAVNRETS